MAQQFAAGYALLIGVDENSVPHWALPSVARDIDALAAVLTHPQRCAYPAGHVRTIAGPEATRQGILDGLDWLREQIERAGDDNLTAVLYYSGHGWRSARDAFYLIPYDARQGQIALSALDAHAFSRAIAALRPQRLLVLLDCCHAGGMGAKEVDATSADLQPTALPPAWFMGQVNGALGPQAKGLSDLAVGRGRAVLSSSTGDQSSYVRADGLMSVFTYHLIEALTGHAQPQEGATEVLVSDVMGHVYRRVPQTVAEMGGGMQQPDYLVTGNFPIALLLGGQGLAKGQPAPDPLPVTTNRGGDTITIGDVSNSTFAVGEQAKVVVYQGQERASSADPLARVERVVGDLPGGADKTIAQGVLQGLRDQAQKGPAAQEDVVAGYLDHLAGVAPEAWQAALDAFVQQETGLGPAFANAARRAQKQGKDRA